MVELFPEIVDDPGSGVAGHEELQPLDFRVGVARSDDFDLVACLEGLGKRNELAVYLGRDCVVSYSAVYQVGKIQGGAAVDYGLLFPLWGKDDYVGGNQIGVNDVQQFERIDVLTAQNLLYALQPPVHFGIVFRTVAVLLVHPVRGNSLFGDVIHPSRTDLDFDPDASPAHQRAMERLVTVGLRVQHPVAETPRQLRVNACQYGQYGIGIHPFGIDVPFHRRLVYDPDSIYVVNLFERHVLGLHLVPDGIRRLYPLLEFETVALC